MEFIGDWFKRHLSNRQLVVLVLVVTGITIVVLVAGNFLAPILTAVIIAYLLQGIISRLTRLSIPPSIAFWLVLSTSLATAVLLAFVLIPILIRQTVALMQQVPSMLSATRRALVQLPEEYPDLITKEQINQLFATLSTEVLDLGQTLLSYSFSSAVTVIAIVVYVVLVPFLVYFMVRDKDLILNWFLNFLPQERTLANQVWMDVDGLIDRYIQGKVFEIFIVGIVAYITFLFLDLEYSLLLAALTGVSVLIPYIGATVVTLPVALVAYYQFGFSDQFAYVVIAYLVIQLLDGNVLVPILFGEAVNLHPVAIIAAVLFFGSIWGFWGVFFAIPLATVIASVIKAWPRLPAPDEPPPDQAL